MSVKYCNLEYWSARYLTEVQGGAYDWYLDYTDLKEALEPHLPEDKAAEILYIGCGLSTLGIELAKDERTAITCVDWAQKATEAMTSLATEHGVKLTCQTADVTTMELTAATHTCIIDKGLFDAHLTGDQGTKGAGVLAPLHNALALGGKLIIISHTDRTSMLQESPLSWQIDVSPVEAKSRTGRTYYLHALTKVDPPPPEEPEAVEEK